MIYNVCIQIKPKSSSSRVLELKITFSIIRQFSKFDIKLQNFSFTISNITVLDLQQHELQKTLYCKKSQKYASFWKFDSKTLIQKKLILRLIKNFRFHTKVVEEVKISIFVQITNSVSPSGTKLQHIQNGPQKPK